MSTEVKLRQAKPEDAAAIRDLHVLSIQALADQRYSKKVIAAWSSGKEAEQYVEAMASGEQMIVAEKDGQIIGFGSVLLAEQEVRAVYVHPGHTRKRIGQLLLTELEKTALNAGLTELKLTSSLNAVDFYLAAGFSKGESFQHAFSNGVELECVSMKKDLYPQK